jgi:hypothetical protein
MKGVIALWVFLITQPLEIYAQTSPFSRQYFEFGFGAAVGFANDFIGAGDLLQKNIMIDFDALLDKIGDDGINLNCNVEGDIFFLNVNMQGSWNFGLFTRVDGGIYANLPKSFFSLLTEGNIKNHSPKGEFTVSGGIFADVGLNAQVRLFEKLKIGITPVYYVPIIYIPKSVIRYELEAEDSLKFQTVGEFNIYTPFSLDTVRIDNSLFGQGGADISLDAEYALCSFLDAGTTISHIPLVPAVLDHYLYLSSQFEIDGSNILQNQELVIPDFEFETQYNTNASYTVIRPLRFDFYALFKPLKTNLFVLRPNIGFTVLNASEETNFNWGIEARLNLKDLFRVSLGTGYEETLWKHRLGLALNLRVFELNLEVGLRSQRFVNSFMLNGVSVGVGLCFGW